MLYNKHRPVLFSDVVGQEEITTILKRQVKNNRIGHAYLFSGHFGCGKTTTARILKMAVNCHNPEEGEPCLKCPSCISISRGMDTDNKELDAASNNGVDNVREIIQNVQFASIEAKKKVYIIDEAHMLSNAAFNAFLKVLEEPPEDVLFIFCSTEPHKIPATIRSRCQKYNFKGMTRSDMIRYMKKVADAEGIDIPDASLAVIAQGANGAMRDALSLLELISTAEDKSPQAVAKTVGACSETLIASLLEAIMQRNLGLCMKLINQAEREGYKVPYIKEELMHLLEEFIVYSFSDEAERKKLRKPVISESVDMAVSVMRGLTEGGTDLRTDIIKMCSVDNFAALEALEKRVCTLEKGGILATLAVSDKNEDDAEFMSGIEPIVTEDIDLSEDAEVEQQEPGLSQSVQKEATEGFVSCEENPFDADECMDEDEFDGEPETEEVEVDDEQKEKEADEFEIDLSDAFGDLLPY